MQPPAQATTTVRFTGAPTSGAAIVGFRAWATSFTLPAAHSVRLGVSRTLRRDAVGIKVTTEDGVVGRGESHHGRVHSALAHLVTHALKPMILRMDASQREWHLAADLFQATRQPRHRRGCGSAMSGLDMVLWDIRGKATGWPLYKLLGGASKPVPAYAGGVALGWKNPSSLVDEAAADVQAGISALASACKLAIHPHSSMTGIDMAATLHVLAAIERHGYFEADVSHGNLFRDELVATPLRSATTDACVLRTRPASAWKSTKPSPMPIRPSKGRHTPDVAL